MIFIPTIISLLVNTLHLFDYFFIFTAINSLNEGLYLTYFFIALIIIIIFIFIELGFILFLFTVIIVIQVGVDKFFFLLINNCSNLTIRVEASDRLVRFAAATCCVRRR